MRRIDLSIPKKWIELSNKQLLQISRLYLLQLPVHEFKMLTFLHLSGLKVITKPTVREKHDTFQWFKFKKEKPFVIDTFTLANCIQATSFLVNDIGEMHPLKKLRGAKPCDYRMYKTKFRQYFTAMNFFAAYSHTNSQEHLNQFLASIYLMPWQKFSDNKIKHRAKRFRKAIVSEKYTVVLWWHGFESYLRKNYKYLFNESSGGGDPDLKAQFDTVMNALTHGDITRDEKVLNSPTHRALAQLNEMAWQSEKNKPKK